MNQWISTTLKAVIGASGTALLTPGWSRAQPDSPRYPYAIFQLPTLGGIDCFPWTLNDAGMVVGSTYLSEPYLHATMWIDGAITDLGTLPGGQYSTARGINENGWVVGWASPPGGGIHDHRAFALHDGVMEDLGDIGGNYVEAYGINDHNQIVGWAALDNSLYGPALGFFWDNGVMTALPTLGPLFSNASIGAQAIGVNDSGLIVGQAWSDEYSYWRPVIWQHGQIHDIGTFRSDNRGLGICIGVNDAGYVVGYAEASDRFFDAYRGFVYYNGEKHELPSLPEWGESYAWAINDHRQIVGGCRLNSNLSEDIGCIWQWNRPVRYLNDLIPPGSNWHTGIALGINNLGQITGTGYRPDDPNTVQGFFMVPIHQTIRLSRAQPGTAGAVNTLKVHGATPGAQVTFIYGDKGGGSAIPGCTLEENALQIDSPIILATITANANGVAELRGYVPSGARGRTVLIQAFVQGECGVSQLVVQRFE